MTEDARKVGGTPENPVRINLACAWHGKDLRDETSWIWRIQPEHVAEMDAALHHSKEKGLAEQDVTKDDFPRDGFAEELARMVQALEYGRGVVLMRGFPVELSLKHI